jgi:two-component system phosphate regulon response regulator PhoB
MAQILVVDDTRDVCTAMAKLLRAIGHTAFTAFSGEEALDVLTAASTLPDLVILDQMMPGMDGMEVLRTLRQQERTANLRVVIFSAIAEPVFQTHALSKGANAYWAKGGFDYGTLGDRISDVITANGNGKPHRLADQDATTIART